MLPGPDRELEAHQHHPTDTPSGARWRDREEQKCQPSKDYGAHCKPPHPKAKCLSQICTKQDALSTFRVPLGALGCTQELRSETELRLHQRKKQNLVWTERGGGQRGNLGKVRESFMEKGALGLGLCRISRSSLAPASKCGAREIRNDPENRPEQKKLARNCKFDCK